MRKLCKASVRPNPFLNLNSNSKKIPLRYPHPPTFAPLLFFNPPNACAFTFLPPLNPPTPPQPTHLPHLTQTLLSPPEIACPHHQKSPPPPPEPTFLPILKNITNFSLKRRKEFMCVEFRISVK